MSDGRRLEVRAAFQRNRHHWFRPLLEGGRGAVPLPAVALIAGIAVLTACGKDSLVSQRPATAFDCTAASPNGAWVPGPGERLVETNAFGRGEEQWLQGPRGLTYAGSGVWVYDGERGYLWKISGGLDSARIVASRGEGPGELRPVVPPMFGQWITPGPGPNRITVFDGRSLHVFDTAGAYVTRTPAPPPGMSPFEVRRVVAVGDIYLYGKGLSSRPFGPVWMEVWHFGDGGGRLLHAAELPIGTGIASQMWDVAGECLIAVDGASLWIYRIHLPSGAVDSLPLPSYDPPPSRPGDDALRDARLREIAALGGRTARELPTGELPRWAALRADPSGYVWVRGWRPSSYGSIPDTVFAVHPDGRQTSFATPTFPEAFGSDGRIYGFTRDPVTGVTIVLSISITGN